MVTESSDFFQKPRMSLKQKWIWLEDTQDTFRYLDLGYQNNVTYNVCKLHSLKVDSGHTATHGLSNGALVRADTVDTFSPKTYPILNKRFRIFSLVP